jgi:hypothetical protein
MSIKHDWKITGRTFQYIPYYFTFENNLIHFCHLPFIFHRARSAYKLIEIDDKHHILKPGFVVVECGSSPGLYGRLKIGGRISTVILYIFKFSKLLLLSLFASYHTYF